MSCLFLLAAGNHDVCLQSRCRL